MIWKIQLIIEEHNKTEKKKILKMLNMLNSKLNTQIQILYLNNLRLNLSLFRMIVIDIYIHRLTIEKLYFINQNIN